MKLFIIIAFSDFYNSYLPEIYARLFAKSIAF